MGPGGRQLGLWRDVLRKDPHLSLGILSGLSGPASGLFRYELGLD